LWTVVAAVHSRNIRWTLPLQKRRSTAALQNASDKHAAANPGHILECASVLPLLDPNCCAFQPVSAT
jgi:hypothetical protein